MFAAFQNDFDAFVLVIGEKSVVLYRVVVFVCFTKSIFAGGLIFFLVFKKRNDIINVFIKLQQSADALLFEMFERVNDEIAQIIKNNDGDKVVREAVFIICGFVGGENLQFVFFFGGNIVIKRVPGVDEVYRGRIAF